MPFNEQASRENRKEAENLVAKTADEEVNTYRPEGIVTDRLRALEDVDVELPGGEILSMKEGELYEYEASANLVLDECSVLIASLIKGHAGIEGATYWEVGQGLDTWDDNNPPSPSKGDTSLTNPTFRKAIDPADIEFIDESNNISASPTNRIQIQIKFLSDEANGSLREFSIFGGDATDTLGSGLIINRKTHGHIFKTTSLELDRTLRITF